MSRDRICIDFDNVIHLWDPRQSISVVEGDPVPGAKEAIALLRKNYKVVVLTARASKGQKAIARWLKEQGIVVDGITSVKPPALIYLDDRALHFYGDWTETLRDIKQFRTWK